MNYELAKRLKDAGFPQEVYHADFLDNEMWIPEKRGGSWFYFVTPALAKYAKENNGEYAGCIGFDFIEDNDSKFNEFVQDYYAAPENKRIELFGEFAKIPTLEELIEAVRITHPIKSYNGEMFDLEGHWMHDFGYQARLTVIINLEPGEEKEWKEWGNTFSEAVANLWLALKKII